MPPAPLLDLLDRSLAARSALLAPPHDSALRLFNGFTEGFPELVLDLYGSTLLITNYSDPPDRAGAWLAGVEEYLRDRLPWLQAGVLKTRNGGTSAEPRGRLFFGERPESRIQEHGVW
jgi:23S rRNA (cytosine1962-C5)-methyltransferase